MARSRFEVLVLRQQQRAARRAGSSIIRRCQAEPTRERGPRFAPNGRWPARARQISIRSVAATAAAEWREETVRSRRRRPHFSFPPHVFSSFLLLSIIKLCFTLAVQRCIFISTWKRYRLGLSQASLIQSNSRVRIYGVRLVSRDATR